MFNLNAKGPLFAVQKFAPLISRGGSVVLTTSIANVKGMAGNAHTEPPRRRCDHSLGRSRLSWFLVRFASTR
jgi:NAD(P)-dependent dehydrogenase (short-subunit alcohol dehydrogenase family)